MTLVSRTPVDRSKSFAATQSLKSGDVAFLILVALTGASLFSGIETRVAGKIVRPFDALIALSTLWMMGNHLRPMMKALTQLKGIFLAWILLMGIRAASSYLNGMEMDAVVGVIQAGEFAMLMLAIAVATRSTKLRDTFIKIFLFLIASVAIYAFVLHLAGGAVKSLKLLDEPKYSFGFVCIFLIAGWISGRPRMPSWLRFSMLGPAIVLLLISGERSAWLGMIGVMAALARLGIFSLRTRSLARRLIAPIVVLSLIGSLVIVILSQTNEYVSRQLQRFAEPISLVDWKTGDILYQYAESPSNKARLFQIANLIDIAKIMPLTGTGTDLYRSYAYSVSAGSGLQVISGMHGQYTLFFAENGIFAFVLYSLIWVFFFLSWKKAWRSGNAEVREALLFVYAVGVYSAIITWFIAGGSTGLFITFLPVGLMGGILLQKSAAMTMGRRPSLPNRPAMHARSV